MLSRHISSYWGGISTRSVKVDNLEASYLEAGEAGEAVLLIHGFAGSKAHWRSIMMALKKDYRVIAVEVPGFNLRQWLPGKRHTLRHLAQWLNSFVTALGLDQLHMVGFSAGACLSSYYASSYPATVKSLAFLSFPNLYLEEERLYKNIFDECLYSEINCAKDMSSLWDSLFYKPPPIPSFFHGIWFKAYQNRKPSLLLLLKELSDSSSILYPRLSKLACATLAIRGEFDENSSPEMNNYLQRAIPQLETVQIEKTSHLCYIERQDVTIDHLLTFIVKAEGDKPSFIGNISA